MSTDSGPVQLGREQANRLLRALDEYFSREEEPASALAETVFPSEEEYTDSQKDSISTLAFEAYKRAKKCLHDQNNHDYDDLLEKAGLSNLEAYMIWRFGPHNAHVESLLGHFARFLRLLPEDLDPGSPDQPHSNQCLADFFSDDTVRTLLRVAIAKTSAAFRGNQQLSTALVNLRGRVILPVGEVKWDAGFDREGENRAAGSSLSK